MIEAKYLAAEVDGQALHQQLDGELMGIVNQSSINLESKTNVTSCPVCRPYSMRVDPRILRNITGR